MQDKTAAEGGTLELRIGTTHAAIDWVTTVVAARGYAGNVRVERAAELDNGGAGGQGRPSPWTHTVALSIAAGQTGPPTVDDLLDALAPLRRVALVDEVHVVRQDGLADTGARTEPHRIGQRFVVLHDAETAAATDTVPLRVVRHLAFGSGVHPTTAASLVLIERHVLAGMRVLDLGCGSGILSVAMAKLGARVVAVDNDPLAVRTALANIRANDVAERVAVQLGSLGAGAGLGHWMGWTELASVPTVDDALPFDLIVANILARVHMTLAPDYHRALRRGPAGTLIIAGFTTDQEQDAASALGAAGFEPVDRAQVDEYPALALRPVR